MLNRVWTTITPLLMLASSPVWAGGGDAQVGKQLYDQRCAGCHSVDTNRIGPMHQGIIGRKAGGVADYAYSDALKRSKVVWDEKNLAQWLANPEAFIPGQKMGYQVSNPQDREHLVAYLKHISSK